METDEVVRMGVYIGSFLYAYMWTSIAKSRGGKDAEQNLDILVKQMTPAQISDAQKLARECVRKNYKGC